MEEGFIDAIRGLHLLFLALGLGSAFYLDFRTVSSLNRVLEAQDVIEMKRIHDFVTGAFIGLWITGLFLVWLRTSFDISQFSPKLWCKLGVVTFMTFVAAAMGAIVLPAMEAQIGKRIFDLDIQALIPLSAIISFSAFCWITALALGSSKVLKSAAWDLLSTLLLAGGATAIIVGVGFMLSLRAILRGPAKLRRDPFDRLLELSRQR